MILHLRLCRETIAAIAEDLITHRTDLDGWQLAANGEEGTLSITPPASAGVFAYELCSSTLEVRERIRACEGRHVQQAVWSTFMDTLTQVCFTEQVVRSTIAWEGNRSWKASPQP